MKINLSGHCFELPVDEFTTVSEYLLANFKLERQQYSLRSFSGRILQSDRVYDTEIHVHLRIMGGKGGFGANLRRQGARMGKNVRNFESCRDLSGRRLRTLNEAKRLQELREIKDELEREKREKLDKKIETGLKAEVQKKKFDDYEWLAKKDEMKEKLRQETLEVMESVGPSTSVASETLTANNLKQQQKKQKQGLKRKKMAWDSTSESEPELEVETFKPKSKARKIST